MRSTTLFTLFIAFAITFTSCGQQSNQDSDVPMDVKIGQMLKIGFRGMQVADTNHIARDLQQYHLGGVVLFDYDVPRDTAYRNIQSPEQVKQLVNELKALSDKPLIVSIDQEGGRVARLKPKYGFPKSVSAEYLGSLDNPDSTRYYARRTAETLSNMGINVNLAPVVDVNVNPDNPVIGGLERSFSGDPQTVAKHAGIYIKTLHNYDIQTVLKHFPGHGSSEKDSHLGVVDVTDTWSRKELIPYRQLIDSSLVDAVMTAHIFNSQIDSTYPATLSKPTIDGILRDSLGFDGVVISDDLMMGAIRKEYGLKTTIEQALRAGVDILSFANNSVYDPEIVPKAHRIIKELIEKGEISTDRIDESYQRIMKFKEQLN
ncbi:MAG: glycoside hydrolase family 3 protein [Fodinibius sp.]|nr:glycoside hydrolase family 3 protein [Fodinibius sp.]